MYNVYLGIDRIQVHGLDAVEREYNEEPGQ